MSSIYIHWPFCNSKCTYCNFYSIVQENLDYNAWVERYSKVLSKMSLFFRSNSKNEVITSIFFGGGTPSLLPENCICKILDSCAKYFVIDDHVEITLEANPCTLNKHKLQSLKNTGINRLSIGIQSINDVNLKMLGRKHSPSEGLDMVTTASDIFDNVSADFIYNIPGQSINEWGDELKVISSLPLKHVSLYELIVEDGTKMSQDIQCNKIPMPDQDNIEFITRTYEVISNAGFTRYEISNFAKQNYMCRHSLSYWNYDEYYAAGPSSHARVMQDNKKYAIEQVCDTNKWLKWVDSGCNFNMVELTDIDILREKIIMGLRTIFGLDITEIPNQYNQTICDKINVLQKNNLAKLQKNRLILTDEGFIRLNKIVEYLA